MHIFQQADESGYFQNRIAHQMRSLTNLPPNTLSKTRLQPAEHVLPKATGCLQLLFQNKAIAQEENQSDDAVRIKKTLNKLKYCVKKDQKVDVTQIHAMLQNAQFWRRDDVEPATEDDWKFIEDFNAHKQQLSKVANVRHNPMPDHKRNYNQGAFQEADVTQRYYSYQPKTSYVMQFY